MGSTRDDRGQQRRFALAAGHEVPARHERPAHAAVDRRDDPGELEIELRGAKRGGHGVVCGPSASAAAPVRRSRSSSEIAFSVAQPIGAPLLGRRAIAPGTRLRQLRAEPLDLRLERPVVDFEEHLSLPDQAALLKRDPGDQARDSRPDSDRLDGLEPAGELVPLGHVARDGGRSGHLRQWWCGLLGLDPRARGEPDGQRPAATRRPQRAARRRTLTESEKLA